MLRPEAVRERVRAAVARMEGVARVVADPGDPWGLRVWLTPPAGGPDAPESLLSLGNLYAQYQRKPDDLAGLDGMIAQFLARTVGVAAAAVAAGSTLVPESWETVRGSLCLRLERQDRIAAIVQRSDGHATPITRPWCVPELCVSVVYDTPRTMHPICQHDLAAWGVTEDAVVAQAAQHLRARTAQGPAFAPVHTDIYTISTADGYAAARLLALTELRQQLPPHLRDRRMVVAAPCRDLLLALPANRDDLAATFAALVATQGQPYGLSPTLYDWRGDDLTPVLPQLALARTA